MILRCGGAPSYFHQRRLNWPFHCRRNRGNSASINGTFSLLTMSRYISQLRFCREKNGPTTPPFPISPTHTVSYCLASIFSNAESIGFWPRGAYFLTLCVLMNPFKQKELSSPMQRSSRKRGGLARSQLQKFTLLG